MSATQAAPADLLVLRALSALLTYPSRDLVAALPEIGEAISQSPLLSTADRDRLANLALDLRTSAAAAPE